MIQYGTWVILVIVKLLNQGMAACQHRIHYSHTALAPYLCAYCHPQHAMTWRQCEVSNIEYVLHSTVRRF